MIGSVLITLEIASIILENTNGDFNIEKLKYVIYFLEILCFFQRMPYLD